MKFLDFRKNLKIGPSSMGKFYIVSALTTKQLDRLGIMQSLR